MSFIRTVHVTLISPSIRASPTLDFVFAPVIDGIVIKDHLISMVQQGHIRPNTPITWSYSKDDAWNFSEDAFNFIMTKYFPSESAESITSPYIDKFFEIAYPSHAAQLRSVFGCGAKDCKEQFARWIQASHWYCNTRWALKGATQHSHVGPVYPVQFEEPNCDNQTKSCHCSEGAYVRGQRATQFGRQMKATWGEFYKRGESSLEAFDSSIDKFNIVSASKWAHEEVLDWAECDVLDAIGIDAYVFDQ